MVKEDSGVLCVYVFFVRFFSFPNSHMAGLIDMKNKPIDEALREFQKMFLMPVGVTFLGMFTMVGSKTVMASEGVHTI